MNYSAMIEAMNDRKVLVPHSLWAMLQTRTDARFDSRFITLVKATCDQVDAMTTLRAQVGSLEGQLDDSEGAINQLIRDWGYLVDLYHTQERLMIESGISSNVLKKRLYNQLHGAGWTDPKTGLLLPGVLELFGAHWKENNGPCLAVLNLRRRWKDAKTPTAPATEAPASEGTDGVTATDSAVAVDLVDGDEAAEVFVTEQELLDEQARSIREACIDEEVETAPPADSASDQEPIVEVADSESDGNKSPTSHTGSDSAKRSLAEPQAPFVSPDGGQAAKKAKSTGGKGVPRIGAPKNDDAYD